jgi:hypothetical protein
MKQARSLRTGTVLRLSDYRESRPRTNEFIRFLPRSNELIRSGCRPSVRILCELCGSLRLARTPHRRTSNQVWRKDAKVRKARKENNEFIRSG